MLTKLSDLANDYLEFLVKKYSNTHNKVTNWDEIKEYHPELDDKFICDAFRALCKSGFVNNRWFDNLPCIVTLDVTAVIEAEKNTSLVKMYKCLKELRSWL